MYDSTIATILKNLIAHHKWKSSLVFPNADGTVYLSFAMGKNPVTPPEASNQPLYYPRQTQDPFDPTIYNSLEDFTLLETNLKTVCPGCIFYFHRRKAKKEKACPQYHYIYFVALCSHHNLHPSSDSCQVYPGKYSLKGAKI